MSRTSLVSRLLKFNYVPSDDERALIESDLERLHNERRQISRHRSSCRTEEEVKNTTVQLTETPSPSQQVPAEIWEQIFPIALADITNQQPDNPYDTALRNVCNVCRMWMMVAVHQQALWTRFPTFEFDERTRKRPEGSGSGRKPTTPKRSGVVRRLKQYIKRSGELPFSFGFLLLHADGYDLVTHELLEKLVGECHRWEGALLCLPSPRSGHMWVADLHLASTVGRLPLLSSLNLTISGPMSRDAWTSVRSIFLDAPKLRCVTFNTPRGESAIQPNLNLKLPWSQIEEFEGLCYGDVNDSFFQLYSHGRGTLKRFKGEIEPRSQFTVHTMTLDRLTTLHLRLRSRGETLQYLAGLTLPSLEDLELRGDVPRADPLLEFVQSLVQRSQCYLKRLALGVCSSDLTPVGLPAFAQFLAQCRLLTELEVPSTYIRDEQLLGCLVDPLSQIGYILPASGTTQLNFKFEEDSQAPCILPSLERLTLRSFGRDDPQNWMVDPRTVTRMVTPRDASNRSRSDTHSGVRLHARLNEVRFAHSPTSPDTFCHQLDLIDSAQRLPGFGRSNFELQAAVKRWGKGLADILYHSDDGSRSRSVDHVRRRDLQMDALMREMEKCRFLGDCDLRILARRGIPQLLTQMCDQLDDVHIPSINLRERAKALCERWKPKLLADYRSSPYRWYRIDKDSATLVYIPPGSDEADETLWANIMGRGVHTCRARKDLNMPWESASLLERRV